MGCICLPNADTCICRVRDTDCLLCFSAWFLRTISHAVPMLLNENASMLWSQPLFPCTVSITFSTGILRRLNGGVLWVLASHRGWEIRCMPVFFLLLLSYTWQVPPKPSASEFRFPMNEVCRLHLTEVFLSRADGALCVDIEFAPLVLDRARFSRAVWKLLLLGLLRECFL